MPQTPRERVLLALADEQRARRRALNNYSLVARAPLAAYAADLTIGVRVLDQVTGEDVEIIDARPASYILPPA